MGEFSIRGAAGGSSGDFRGLCHGVPEHPLVGLEEARTATEPCRLLAASPSTSHRCIVSVPGFSIGIGIGARLRQAHTWHPCRMPV